FMDSGGWGYAEFEYDATSGKFRPGTLADTPPQGNNATCGLTCHSIAKTRDYVFTQYAHRGRGLRGNAAVPRLSPSLSPPMLPIPFSNCLSCALLVGSLHRGRCGRAGMVRAKSLFTATIYLNGA